MTSPAEPGGIVSCAIILNAKLSVHARHLYAALCCVVDDRREIERSKPELIEDSGMSRATLHRAMAELIEAGIVEVHSSINSDGGTRTNRYSLNEGGLTQRLPPAHTETPGVSEGDPLKESAAQTPVSEGDPPGSQRETGEGVSEGDGGSSLYKKGEGVSSTLDQLDKDHYHKTKKTLSAEAPATLDPAPEEPTTMTGLNFNDPRLAAFIKPDQPPAKKTRRASSRPTEDPDFDKAWELYNFKESKLTAQKAWVKARRMVDAQMILNAIPAYVATTLGKGEPERRSGGFMPRRALMATWLNQERWNDEIEAPKPGYQGRAGSDVRSLEGELERAKTRPICKLMRTGPMPGDLGWNRAWYFHWNIEQQRHWTREQLLETGNSPEDVDWLAQAYAHGIDADLYQRMLADINGSDAR